MLCSRSARRTAAALALLAAPAAAQVTFSFDAAGPRQGATDCTGVPVMLEGDVLTPCAPYGTPALGPLAPPLVVVPATGAGGLGLTAVCPPGGPAPGASCRVEVDALSYGLDGLLERVDADPGKLAFSVDVYAVGHAPSPQPPSVATEGQVPGAVLGDAAADLFGDLGLPLGTTFPLPAAFAGGNTGLVDGNGLPSASGYVYPGTGLVEPNGPIAPPNIGDNLDAGDLESPLTPPPFFPAGGVCFSLEGPLVDPYTGIAGSSSAAAQGFVGGDVLVTLVPGGPPVLYAPAAALGLDVFGVDTDDLDALALREEGTPGFQPSQQPFDWMPAGSPFDMLLFSVRRGSAVIGMPDSLTGRPIEEGDVLSTPVPPGLGGLSPFPALVVPAEQLGLPTVRSGSPGPFGRGDDLDALDVLNVPPPLVWSSLCHCPTGPCGNDDPSAGCENSTGVGGLLTPSGTSSQSADNLVLTATQLPTFQQGLYYMGDTVVNNFFFDGIQCALGTTARFSHCIQSSGAGGTMTCTSFVANSGGLILPGTTWIFQCWYRDVPGTPCLTGANLTNGVSVLFTP